MSNHALPLEARPVAAFSDNYIWLAGSPNTPGRVLAVDPGEASPLQDELDRSGASLAAILLTHHHPDHIGGVAELLRRWNVPVFGPRDERIPFPVRAMTEGDRCNLPDLGLSFETFQVPGHTLSHIAFWGHGALFCGDTLFSAGCGRLFEGTPTQMTDSLNRLRALPSDTRVYCGHEYTAANVRFALAVEPDNEATRRYQAHVHSLRGRGESTLPSTIGLEREVNPFLRCDVPAVAGAAARQAGRPLESEAQVFGALRAWKDAWRS